MDKNRISKLIPIADEALAGSSMLGKDKTINSSYDGLVSAFPVSVAMSGLKPTIIIYAQDKDSGKVNRGVILEVLLKMLLKMMKMDGFTKIKNNAKNDVKLPSTVAELKDFVKTPKCDQAVESALKREMIDCAIALKLVVRTYKQVES